MHYRLLGRTGLNVSEIGLGCASYWGKKIFSEAEAIRIVHAAIDHGVTFFDTGASYSGGNAEPRLGRALSGLRDRHDLIISTKAGSYTDDRNRRREDFSPAGIRRTVEASLVRLGLDVIPILHLHGPEIRDITDELVDALCRLREEGKVRSLSVNSFDTKVIEHVMAFPQFDAVMIDYNVLRPERDAIIRKLAAQNVGVIAGMALGSGLYRKGRFRIRGIQDAWYFARAWKNHRSDVRRGRALRFIDDEEAHSGGKIALAWVLHNPNIGCAVFGTTREAHLIDNLRASEEPLDQTMLHEIARAQLSFS